jgi:hypothetical protein
VPGFCPGASLFWGLLSTNQSGQDDLDQESAHESRLDVGHEVKEVASGLHGKGGQKNE